MAALWPQVEVHKAYVELHKAYVELHKAYVERLGGSGTHPGCSQALLEPSGSRLGSVLGHLGPILAQLWYRFGIVLVSMCCHFEIILN